MIKADCQNSRANQVARLLWARKAIPLAIACDSLDQVGGDGDEGDAVDGNDTFAMMRVIAITR